VLKFFSKKRLKSIVGVKKGFYICTRLARKRAENKKTHPFCLSLLGRCSEGTDGEKFINILN
tara:strand:+ start:199 stop:384 length:186 start_codon:yes stop_codon:yes gene_type:complete